MKRRASNGDARELAHDLNNLLTAIIGATDAILERSAIDPDTRADIAHIREGAFRGAALVQRFRGVGPDRPAPPDLVSVNETIRATSRLLAHRLGANIALAMDLAEPDGQVRAEPSQLDRVLLNLIGNARHAMPTGGTVTLRTRRRIVTAADPRVPDTIPTGDYVVIAVTDTGTGIPRDQLPRIFDPGFSSRHRAGGSGLGLSSVREIVRQSNGFIAVASVAGRGTCFEIYLPRQTDQPPPLNRQPLALATARTVLLVDDDPFVREVTERVLRRAGWSVLCADSAEAALAILDSAPCDLMISDVAMPGMDGMALARLVLARQPDFPIILTSGYERTAAGDTSQTADVAFLPKPYGQADLLAAVTRIAPEPACELSSGVPVARTP